jgi:selenocysteine lyase/cysteine desulfurase
MGYPSITPRGTDTPIVTFQLRDPDDVRKRLARARVAVTVLGETRQMRVSPSVFNTEADVDRLLEALA